MGLCYEDSLAKNIATVVVFEVELAEALLDQEDEGLPDPPPRAGSDDKEDEIWSHCGSRTPNNL